MKALPALVVFVSVATVSALIVAGCVAQPGGASATVRRDGEPLRLGTVDFPTSGSAAAQPHFLHGIAALHSFWYEEALEAFARAREVDPAFTMARWGEAMCYYRPYRSGADHKAGRAAIAKITSTAGLTDRERAYIEAARALYAKPTEFDAKAFATQMEKVHRAHPDDDEAAAFYALALLGNRGGAGSANLEKSGELARAVYQRNPNHPGAAHYIIHSYDDPKHASRALTAAYHYSKIAPDAPHALHMPSHIFLQLGMWHEAAASNDLGWAASVDYVKRKGLTPTLRDYHNLHWLIYASLQRGQHAKAGALVDEFVRMRAAGELASYSARYINSALAAYVIETRRWDRADTLFAAPAGAVAAAAPSAATRPLEICGAEPPTPPTPPAKRRATSAFEDTITFVRSFAAAARGNASAVQGTDIRTRQLQGIAHAQAKDFNAAIATLREAAAAEARTSKPPGPPTFKPTHELLGEVLLLADQPADALQQFNIALDRHPGRSLALLGRARAESALGKRDAARATYTQLLEIWREADVDLAELREAREFAQ